MLLSGNFFQRAIFITIERVPLLIVIQLIQILAIPSSGGDRTTGQRALTNLNAFSVSFDSIFFLRLARFIGHLC